MHRRRKLYGRKLAEHQRDRKAMRGPKRAPSVELDPILCEHGFIEPLPFRDDAKDRKKDWLTRLLERLGL